MIQEDVKNIFYKIGVNFELEKLSDKIIQECEGIVLDKNSPTYREDFKKRANLYKEIDKIENSKFIKIHKVLKNFFKIRKPKYSELLKIHSSFPYNYALTLNKNNENIFITEIKNFKEFIEKYER